MEEIVLVSGARTAVGRMGGAFQSTPAAALASVVHTAARWIECRDAEIVLAGGTENMTMLPFYVRRGRYGYRLGDGMLEDGILSLLSDPFSRAHMGITAETLADKYGT